MTTPPKTCDPPHTPEDTTHLAIRVHMMPKDTNVAGTVFGGVILSLVDQAGFYQVRRHGLHRWVTVSMDAVEFRRPVWPGDVVSLYTSTERTGRTSVTVRVKVLAERFQTGDTVEVTAARLTMVSVDTEGKPIPFADPPSLAPIRSDRD
ncbi:MAG: acyl-CoA thioesterase [Phycisphaerales bacterium]|nr:acyl-CoA thioesterase [Planctomycetaceae bacterium]MDP7086212.1 acyl-CoA thioesterase [Phycisphaerales bacterium]MDP7574043.1 acyl-CoA thioesterase [Phycisphaerales bacterium]|tara:strand:- start:4788 stop:5234 length:447 start_codon:yes stop_codon:yes gene_type:complete